MHSSANVYKRTDYDIKKSHNVENIEVEILVDTARPQLDKLVIAQLARRFRRIGSIRLSPPIRLVGGLVEGRLRRGRRLDGRIGIRQVADRLLVRRDGHVRGGQRVRRVRDGRVRDWAHATQTLLILEDDQIR